MSELFSRSVGQGDARLAHLGLLLTQDVPHFDVRGRLELGSVCISLAGFHMSFLSA